MTQRARILEFLKRGKTLTALSALHLFGCNRLAARIHELREQGFQVRGDMVRTSTGKRIGRYWLQSL